MFVHLNAFRLLNLFLVVVLRVQVDSVGKIEFFEAEDVMEVEARVYEHIVPLSLEGVPRIDPGLHRDHKLGQAFELQTHVLPHFLRLDSDYTGTGQVLIVARVHLLTLNHSLDFFLLSVLLDRLSEIAVNKGI